MKPSTSPSPAGLRCSTGVVHRRQALALGMTPRQIDRRPEAGLLVSLHRSVYRQAAHGPSPEQALMAACLAAGGVASHRSAAALWRLRGAAHGVPEVVVAGRRRPDLAGALVHRTARLEAVDVTRRSGIPVTAPACTVLHLGAVVPVEVLEPAMEDAILRRLVSFSQLARTAERLGAPGRNGAAVLRRLIAARDPATAPTESMLEDLLARVLRKGGLPEPVRQHRVGGVRIDFAYPEARLAIGADGRVWHAGRGDVQRNSSKGNLLVGMGWRVLHFTWFDMTSRPGYVVATVGQLLSHAA